MKIILMGVLPVAIGSAAISQQMSDNRIQYSGEDITDQEMTAQQIDSFQRRLIENGFRGDITSCPTLVRVHHAARNRIVGAICSVRAGSTQRNMLLCEDNGIGHFALSTTFVHDRDAVIRFAFQNCGGWAEIDQSDPGNTTF